MDQFRFSPVNFKTIAQPNPRHHPIQSTKRLLLHPKWGANNLKLAQDLRMLSNLVVLNVNRQIRFTSPK
jgi:hypothetical protein